MKNDSVKYANLLPNLVTEQDSKYLVRILRLILKSASFTQMGSRNAFQVIADSTL